MTDLYNELDRLEKAATPGEWEFVRKEFRETVGNSVKVGDHVVAFTGFDKESPHSPADAEFICWARNHTDEIKAALEVKAQWQASQGLAGIRALTDELLKAAADRDAWKRTADERSSTQLAKRAIEAEAERDSYKRGWTDEKARAEFEYNRAEYLEDRAEQAEAKLDKIQKFLDERADNISCAGYSVTEKGCFTATLASKIQGVLDE